MSSADPSRHVAHLRSLFKFRAAQEMHRQHHMGATTGDRHFFGLISKSSWEIMIAFCVFAVQMFKACMATLLSLTVPQLCPPDPQDGLGDTTHECTLQVRAISQ